MISWKALNKHFSRMSQIYVISDKAYCSDKDQGIGIKINIFKMYYGYANEIADIPTFLPSFNQV